MHCARHIVALLCALLVIGCATPPAAPIAESATTQTSVAPETSLRPSAVPASSPIAAAPVEVVPRSWTAEALLTRQAQEGAPVWADGDELTFVYQGAVDEVRVCCAIEQPMQRVAGGELWTVTVRVANLPKALISYAFFGSGGAQPSDQTPAFQLWRGPQAPPPVARAEPLRGQIRNYTLESVALSQRRELTVYLPPDHDPQRPTAVIYMADGQSVPEFAAVLEPLIRDGAVPPILLVGVHASVSPDDPTGSLRTQEYIPSVNPRLYDAHERFFVDEVSDWAERELGASDEPAERAVFGFSNGAVLAATIGIRRAFRYGHVLAFSLGTPPEELRYEDGPDFYLVSGTLEPQFYETTQSFAATLEARGMRQVFRERVAGHDQAMWQEEFPAAVRWAFGDRQ